MALWRFGEDDLLPRVGTARQRSSTGATRPRRRPASMIDDRPRLQEGEVLRILVGEDVVAEDVRPQQVVGGEVEQAGVVQDLTAAEVEERVAEGVRVRHHLVGDLLGDLVVAAKKRSVDDGRRSEEHTSELQSRQYLV